MCTKYCSPASFKLPYWVMSENEHTVESIHRYQQYKLCKSHKIIIRNADLNLKDSLGGLLCCKIEVDKTYTLRF